MINQKILFSKEECQSILQNIEKWNDIIISVRLDGQLTDRGGVMKSFKINWNNDNNWIKDRVINWVNSLDSISHKINDKQNLSAGYRKYTKGDYFVKHDDHINNGNRRLYTIGIMLYKSDDLVGGDFKMYLNDNIIDVNFDLGKAYIFDSNTPHSVDIVETGERITLMFFIHQHDIKKNIEKNHII